MAKTALKNLAKIFLNEASSRNSAAASQNDSNVVDELVKNLSDIMHDSNEVLYSRGFNSEEKISAAKCANNLRQLQSEKDRLCAEMASMQSNLQSIDNQCIKTECDMKNCTMEEMRTEYMLKERELKDLRTDYETRLEDYKADMLASFDEMLDRDRRRLGRGIEEMRRSVSEMTLYNITVGDEEDMDEPEIIKQQFEMNYSVLEAELREIGYRVMETVTGRSLIPNTEEDVQDEDNDEDNDDNHDEEVEIPQDIRDMFPEFVRDVYDNLKKDGVDTVLNETDLQQSINKFCEDAIIPESFKVRGDDGLEGFVVD